jgi:hypothetical protein
MALIKYGSILSEIRGKVGGQVFSKNASGYTLSNFTKSIINNDPNTVLAKKAVFDASSLWISLSASQQLDWHNQALSTTFYNSLGEAYTPSGYQLFMAVNIQIFRSGSSGISDSVAYSVTTVNVAQPSSIVVSTNTLNFGFNPVAVADSKYYFYSYKPLRVGYQGANPPWRLIVTGASFSQADTTILPIIKQLFPDWVKAGSYLPFMQLSQNYVTGAISRLGLPSIILLS